ncbi:response regulator [Dactylosporangium sucinum]|uniref:Response regulator n=1 Tax=Dactylosporangium sucinum TaxID=1424081 RepID=A0A917UG12_9ACTN|nr:response regulator transcription factor [Dactylosporangium sucinum]GGM90199.1 response regulator [Dactylosporangium sucinum]
MGMRCLIVDDSTAFLAAAERALTSQGINIVGVAHDSAQAIAGIDALRPDVVLVDVYLGEESGFDLAERIEATARDRSWAVRVILISSHSRDEMVDLVHESPALAFVDKAELSARTIHDALNSTCDGSTA